jgi:hypothetical protein
MAEFPAPAEGIVLTHFIVAFDVGRSRRFYVAVLGGEVLREGAPSSLATRRPLAVRCMTRRLPRTTRLAGFPRLR